MDMIKHIDGGEFLLTLKGKFTFTDNTAFRSILAQIAGSSVQQVIFDLSQVEFIDSAALGMLLLAHDEASKHQKPVILRGATGQVSKMIHMARFENYFTIQ